MQQSMQPGWGSAGHGAGSRPAGGAAGGTLARGARITGALISVVLLGVEIAWAVRDVNALGFHDTVRTWVGLELPGRTKDVPATGGLDMVLVVVLAGALATARRPAAGWAFLAAGLFAVVYRVPGLWVFTAKWTKGAPLHDRALTTAIAFVVGGAALVVLALAGRRPAEAADAEPAPPAVVPSVLGGLLLVVVALETAGWHVYYIQKYDDAGYPPHLYKHLLTGETTLSSLLAAPFAYAAWATVALALLGAVLAFRRTPAARPLGLALGFLTLLNGVEDLCSWHAEHLLFTGHLPDVVLTEEIFAVFHVVAGLLLVVFLAQRGSAPAAVPVTPGWTPQPPPAWGSPYQRPQMPPGYQVPHQSTGGGAFGPPPQLPPNLPPGTPPPPAGPPSRPPGSPGSSSGPPAANRDWPSDSR